MRKNTEAVLKAWKANRAKGSRGNSISTDGKTIFSYRTAIVGRVPDYSEEIKELHKLGYTDITQETFFDAVVNVTKYSQTTSSQQNSIIADFKANGITYREVPDVNIGSPVVVGVSEAQYAQGILERALEVAS